MASWRPWVIFAATMPLRVIKKLYYTAMSLHDLYLESVTRRFESLKTLAEQAMAQLAPTALLATPAAGSNSIATICRHITGNMLSRFTGFLHTDGEKEGRNRDEEFMVITEWNAAAEKKRWEEAWKVLLDTLRSLQPGDLEKIVTIRREPHSAVDAINRQLAHYASHVGQIIYIAKMLAGENWKTLSIPLQGSEAFNRNMTEKFDGDKQQHQK